MINPNDYFIDKLPSNNHGAVATGGGILGGIISILYIQPMKFELLFTWEGFIRSLITVALAGGGSLAGVIFKKYYNKLEPRVIRYVSSKFSLIKAKRIRNGKKRNDRKAA